MLIQLYCSVVRGISGASKACSLNYMEKHTAACPENTFITEHVDRVDRVNWSIFLRLYLTG